MAGSTKAPGTGLERATKSIPLSGGMTEEVDDFLLEPGGMQYMENVRYTKKDLAEKAEPLSLAADSGGSNHTVDAYGLWTNADRVTIVTNEAILASDDSGSTWTEHSQKSDLLGIEKVLSTATAQGGFNYTWAPLGIKSTGPEVQTITYYAVAFERYTKVGGAAQTTSRSVVAQIYTTDGSLVYEKTISDGQSPQLAITEDMLDVDLWYAQSDGDLVRERASAATRTFSVQSTTALGIRSYAQYYNSTQKGYGPTGTVLSGEDMRLSHNTVTSLENAQFRVFSERDQDEGVVAWKTDTTVQWQRTTDGALTGSAQTLLTDSSPTFYSVLACFCDLSYAYFLTAATNTTAGGSGWTSVSVKREPLAGGTINTYNFATGIDGQIVNGSAGRYADGDIFAAFTIADEYPDQRMGDTAGNHRVEWYKLNDPFGSPSVILGSEIYSHRLCSNIVLDKDEEAYFVVQQWGNWTPSIGTITNDPAIPGLSLGHKKPRTSILVRVSVANADCDPCGTFDAGQGQAMPGSMDETNIHLGNLLYWDEGTGEDGAHQFWYGNRNVLTAEDNWNYVASAATAAWDENFFEVMLTPGSAKMNLYRMQSSIRVPYATFPDGMFMGTAVPTWYDGSSDLCAVQPLDSPEIDGLFADTDGEYVCYQDLGVTSAGVKVVQCVGGYYDDTGRVHRSAPSIPVYIGNALAEDGNVTYLTAYITPPITIATDRKYFVEVYESIAGGSMALCATRTWPEGNAGTRLGVTWQTNIKPVSTNLDLAPYRSAKVLYTAGNVLAADPWPSFDMVTKSGRRLFAHSIGDPSAIYYSKIFENGVAPEFSASLVVSLGNESITALGAMDDKVLVWTRDGIWFLYGTGPDNTGANGDFFVEKLPHQMGCIDPESIVQYQDGVAFYCHSTKEFQLVTRDLQVTSIGENIKSMTDGSDFNVNRSLVYPEQSEIRWYCTQTPGAEYVADSALDSPPQPPRPFLENQTPTNPVFVYNYKYLKWSVLSEGGTPFHITGLLNGKPCGLKTWDFYKTSTDWTDSQLTKIETPWIKINQLQDFGRFYGLTFLGKYLSSWSTSPTQAGDIQVTVRYDYEGPLGETDTHLWRANVDFDPADGDRLQFRVRPKRQKCQAIKIVIEEVATTAVEVWEPTYTTGQGFILSGVDVHYGAKGGSGDKSLGAARRKG